MTLRVVDDRGHGGVDGGAYHSGIKEKDITLKIGKFFTKYAKEIGIDVISTRTTDTTVSLGNRAVMSRNSRAKYGISHHVNSSSGAGYGIEIWVSQYSDQKLAKEIMREFDKLGLDTSRGIKIRKLNSGADYYYMHRETGNVRMHIIEYGFINNTKDRNYLIKEENQKRLAKAVVNAIATVEGIKQVDKKPLPVEDNLFYRVVTGVFENREYAEKRIEELDKLGYDSFLIPYRK